MTVVALQARVRSVELDGKDQRATIAKMAALQDTLAKTIDRLTKRVDDLAGAGGDEAKERIEAVEARVAETTRMRLELAAHDDRIEALEERGARVASDEWRSLDRRLGVLEAQLGESVPAPALERRIEALALGLAEAQRALGTAQAELEKRDEVIAELMRRLEALEGRSGSLVTDRSASSESEPALGHPESAAGDLAPEPTSGRSVRAIDGGGGSEPVAAETFIPLTEVKGIGPKLSEKLSAAGLDDARRLAAMDDGALATLAGASGIKRGRLERLRAAARAL